MSYIRIPRYSKLVSCIIYTNIFIRARRLLIRIQVFFYLKTKSNIRGQTQFSDRSSLRTKITLRGRKIANRQRLVLRDINVRSAICSVRSNWRTILESRVCKFHSSGHCFRSSSRYIRQFVK